MNTNPNAIRILCYGDSNTWGQVPITKGRYQINERWTGRLQQLLGDEYEIIEEGLGSRTTRWEYSEKEGRNGLTYLSPCLESHNPIDLVILFLGTNDLKEVFNQTPIQIAQSIEILVKKILEKSTDQNGNPSKVLIISPAIVDESVPSTQERYQGAQVKSEGLGKEYKLVAEKTGCGFIDLAKVVQPSKKDGLHFEADAHEKIAVAVREVIGEMVKE